MATQNPYFRVRAEVEDEEGSFVVEFSMSDEELGPVDGEEERVKQKVEERFDFVFLDLLSVEH